MPATGTQGHQSRSPSCSDGHGEDDDQRHDPGELAPEHDPGGADGERLQLLADLRLGRSLRLAHAGSLAFTIRKHAGPTLLPMAKPSSPPKARATSLPGPDRRTRRLLPDHRAWLDPQPRGPRWAGHLLHDGLHRGPQPADHRHPAGRRRPVPRRRRHRQGADPRRGRHRPRRRCDDPADGRRRELPARARHRPRPQRVRHVRHRQAARDDLGRRDGPDRHRGRDHPRAGADRLPAGGLQGDPRPAQDRDLGRHRPVHHDHRPGRRRLRAPHRHRPGPRRARHRRQRSTAGRCSSSSSASSRSSS